MISSVIVTKHLASWTGCNWFELTIVVYYLCLWRVRRCWDESRRRLWSNCELERAAVSSAQCGRCRRSTSF